jgi:hypothetical protein
VVLLLVPFSTIAGTEPSVPAGVGLSGDNHPGAASVAPSNAAPVAPDSSTASSMSWSNLTPGAPWAATGSGFASLPNSGVGLLFGGLSSLALTSRSALYNESNNSWTVLSPSVSPSPRSDFGLGADTTGSGTAVLFGGLLNLTTGQTANDTWLFDFANDSWSNVSKAVAPGPRLDPAFAVDPTNKVGLLYGGWSANSDGTGEITYSDTWELDLTTHVWTRVDVGGIGPGPLRGASLVWQPTLDAFLLYGGCFPCSSAVWEYSLGTATWTTLGVSGPVPTGRMNAVWTWDPAVGLDVLFGGTNDTTVFGTTDYFDPASAAWESTSLSPAPGPRWDASAGFLNATNNATLLLTGGVDGGGPLGDTWRLSQVASLTVQLVNASSGEGLPGQPVSIDAAVLTTNASGFVNGSSLPAAETTVSSNIPGYAERSESFWLAPGSSVGLTLALTPLAPARLAVTVVGTGDTPVVGAFVNLSEEKHLLPGSPRVTNTNGAVLFSNVPSGNATIEATDADYRNNTSHVYLAPGALVSVDLLLLPLTQLDVNVESKLAARTVGLEYVPVTAAGGVLGLTDRFGWLNTTTGLEGSTVFRASAYGYSGADKTVTVASTGTTVVNISLVAEPYPHLIVEVLARTSAKVYSLLGDASVNITSVGLLPTGRYYGNFTTGSNGTVSVSPPVGNYTLQASAPGYQENSSGPVLTALSNQQYVRSIYLRPFGLSNLSIAVRSSVPTHPSISGATVTVNFTSLNLTDNAPYAPMRGVSDGAGWANFSGVPAADAIVSAIAPGYASNSTALVLAYDPSGNTWTIYLTPLPPGTYAGLNIVPTDSAGLWALALVPIAAVLGVLVYLTMLRTPSRREREAERASAAPPPPPPSGSS